MSGYHNKYHRPGMRRKRVERNIRLKKAAERAMNLLVVLYFVALGVIVLWTIIQ